MYSEQCTEEIKEKIRRSMRRVWQNPDYRECMSQAHRGNAGYWIGKSRSEATKGKISQTKLSQHLVMSENARAKISKAQKKIDFASRFRKGDIPWNKGIPCSMETRTKIGESNIGKTKGHPNYLKFHTSETKKKISEALSGENSPYWQGGKSFEPYAKEFNRQLKELIRQRDNYQCQKCGCPEIENIEKLSIHHVDYDKKNCLPSNLIALCRSCNAEVNFKKDYWRQFFTEKISEAVNESK